MIPVAAYPAIYAWVVATLAAGLFGIRWPAVLHTYLGVNVGALIASVAWAALPSL